MSKTIHSTITPHQDEINLLIIHSYLQGRLLFRCFYPSDFPDNFAKNKALYDQAIHGTPEERVAMAAVYMRHTRIQFVVGVCLIIVWPLLLRVWHR